MTHKLDETTARTVAEFMDKMKTTPIFDSVKEIREILAGTDINSLPNDYSTVQMARDRMEEINALRRDALPVKRLRDFIALRPMLQEQFDGPSKRPFTFTMEQAQTIIETMAAMEFYLSALPKPAEVTT